MFGLIKNWRRRNDRHTPRGRGPATARLGMEVLEAREVPAVTAVFDHATGIFKVTGDDLANTIQVEQKEGNLSLVDRSIQWKNIPGLTSPATVNAIPSAFVRKIQVHCEGGNDTATFETIGTGSTRDSWNRFIDTVMYGSGGKDTLMGGAGNDLLFGGTEDDVLRGEYGADRLYGGEGNDTLDGGSGDDFLFGDAGNSYQPGTYLHQYLPHAKVGGNDLLRGGAGNDVLLGEGGNDTLYGQADNDRLFGGWGNDGLFGGTHYDELYGEYGADRLLVWESIWGQAYHAALDVSTIDAVVTFKDSFTPPRFGATPYPAQSWAPGEIELLDEGLKWLHDTTGNTRMLKTYWNDPLVFTRAGSFAGNTIHGWASGGGQQVITSYAFEGGAENARLTVLHEIAHNWQDASTNRIWGDWLALSGWQRYSGGSVPAGKTVSEDRRWVYNTGAVLASGTNPGEDWAWAFEKWYQFTLGGLSTDEGWRYLYHFQLINQFFDSLRD